VDRASINAKFGNEPVTLTLAAGVGALVVVPALKAADKPGPVDVTLLEKGYPDDAST